MAHGTPRLYTCCDRTIKVTRFEMDVPNCENCGKEPQSIPFVGGMITIFNKWIDDERLN